MVVMVMMVMLPMAVMTTVTVTALPAVLNQTLATEKTGRPIDDNVDDDGLLRFVVKRSNALTVVETRRLRFLDITNFIAPRFSYERYLKAYGCELTKGDFPYEWMDSLEKRRCTSLS